MTAAPGADAPTTLSGWDRPERTLPFAHLLNLSLYWMGIHAIWAGLLTVVWQARFTERYGEAFGPTVATLVESIPATGLST